MKTYRVVWVSLVVVGMMGVVAYFSLRQQSPFVSRAVRSLPSNATEVQEYYRDTGFLPDYTRLLRAKLPEADYPAYAKSLGLTRRYNSQTDNNIAADLNMVFGADVDWWTPPAVDETSYFRYEPENEFIEVLRYSNGYVYFVSAAW